MTIQEIWLANLCALVDREAEGKTLRAGYRAVADEAGFSEEYIYQLYNKKPKSNGQQREVSPDAAKKIADAFAEGRPDGWFDQPNAVALHKTDSDDPQKSPYFSPNESMGFTPEKHTNSSNRPLIPVTPQPSPVAALNWEQLMQAILKGGVTALRAGLWVEVSDDSMAREFNPGDQVYLENIDGYSYKAGDLVLVREAGGDLLIREYRAITSKAFDAVPLNPSYGTLHSAAHGLEVLAKVTRVTKMYR